MNISSSFWRHASRWIAIAVCLSAAPSWAQLVTLSTSPLYGGQSAPPNLVVATSVEFPTVGSAYLGIGYDNTATYLGYFDPTKCYTYTSSSGGYFSVSSAATAAHTCVLQFSGNFMNWATMSAIDEFRYAMTGGNRVNESGPSSGTIIERAYLPDGNVSGVPSFYAYGSNFPRQSLTPAQALVNTPIVTLLTLYVTNCKTYVYFGTTTGGNCSSPDTAGGGAYNVRVNVCDSTEGPLRPDLCLLYGSNYKPVGQVQLNAGNIRFAAFGYLMDRNTTGYTVPSGCDDGTGWNRCRYGGVLRAPMKYVGPTKYDASLTPSVNPTAEIDSAGRILTDPEGNASTFGGTYSGFINYINKFGSSGVYKRLDPAGEMYYEAIRYYQNLGPTSLATTGTFNNAVADFFPYYASWTDPILTSCSSNYIINLSDANTWDDTYLPGYNGTPSAGYGRPSSRAVEGGLDAVLWTQRIGTLESTTPSITTNDVRPGLSNIATINTANSASYLLAGAGFWANTNDIRSDLPGKQTIKTISFDVAEASITIQDRQLYLLGKYGGFNNTIDRTIDTYANPFYSSDPTDATKPAIRSNSEWEDSPGSASPANYILASSPQKLIDGLRSVFKRISTTTGNLAGAGLTSSNLTYGGAGAYVATFTPNYSGSVLLKSVSATAGVITVSTGSVWSAGDLLTARCGTVAAPLTTCNDTDTSVNKRNIITTTRSLLGSTRVATPFTFAGITASTDVSYLLMLNTNPYTGLPDLRGQDRLNYLRGDRSHESGTANFRVRDGVMGDIINSAPVYIGPPTTAIPDADYQTFLATNLSRTPMVYVGANDGMLHALRASDGVELFSYVPNFVSPYLNKLSDPGYSHLPFVDTPPKVQEAKVGTSTWKTVLVAAGGAGAQGVFALDVSNPSSFGTSNVLWEFTDADDPDMVNVLTQVEYAKLWVSGPATAKVFKYFAVVTGYNNRRTTYAGTTDSNVSTDTLNKGVLFLLDLGHTLGTTWTLGTDYYKFKFPAAVTTAANGLAPVSLLESSTGDRSTAAMYFGDLQGQVWRLNTYTGDPTTWAPSRGTIASPLPIFNATDSLGNRQPITARVELGRGPFGTTFVFFGTGLYLGSTDLVLPALTQSEYAFLDTNPSVLVTRSSDLVSRTASTAACPTGSLSSTCYSVTGSAFTYSGASAKKGWYLDFPNSTTGGERSITKPALLDGLLTFTTLTLSTDICGAGGGNVFQVNALSGLPVAGSTLIGYSSTVGIPGPPRIVDVALTDTVMRRTGEQINQTQRATLVSGTSANIAQVGATVTDKAPPIGRINWREITNWNDKTGH